MLGLILTIQSVVALIQRGLTTANAITEAVKAGHTAIVGNNNQPIAAADLVAKIDATLAQAAATGDAAAGRIEGRHQP